VQRIAIVGSGGAGCPEAVSLEFLKWVWDYPSRGRKRLEAELADHALHARVVELRSPRSVAAFLADSGGV
jgi:hypothetical protein